MAMPYIEAVVRYMPFGVFAAIYEHRLFVLYNLNAKTPK